MKQEFATEAAQNLETKPDVQEKRAYSAPELKEHGSVQDVTLQTFFGSFSP
jgi:hypothetical protein